MPRPAEEGTKLDMVLVVEEGIVTIKAVVAAEGRVGAEVVDRMPDVRVLDLVMKLPIGKIRFRMRVWQLGVWLSRRGRRVQL